MSNSRELGAPARASAQFSPIEVAALEKRQRHLKNPSLASLKFEFLSTLRHVTAFSDLGLSNFSSLLNHNPGPTFRAGHARARNAIGHIAQLYCAINERPSPVPRESRCRGCILQYHWVLDLLRGGASLSTQGENHAHAPLKPIKLQINSGCGLRAWSRG